MKTNLSGQTALVTGSSRGIGQAICRALDGAGAEIILHYHVNRKAAEETSGGLSKSARLIAADLGSLEAIEKMFEELSEYRLDILINNAGIWKPTPLGLTSKETLRELVDLNLAGPFWVTNCALPFLNSGARIINISSVAGRIGIAGGRSLYGATKAAIDSFTRNWALELAERGIRVNAVAPGYVETDMTLTHLGDPQIRQRALERHPLGRLGIADDIANAVLFLCSPEAGFITGQSVNVSGGFVI